MILTTYRLDTQHNNLARYIRPPHRWMDIRLLIKESPTSLIFLPFSPNLKTRSTLDLH